jgi:hypothetical protein
MSVENKWEWTPPATMPRRRHVYAVMAVLTGIALYVAWAGEIRLGSESFDAYEPVYQLDVEETAPPIERTESLEATEARVLGEGYQLAQTWTQIQVPSGERSEVTIAVEGGASYLMLARGAVSCDTDLVLTDEIQDVGLAEDARIEFSTASATELVVVIEANSPELSTCEVNYALYRR